MLPPERIAGFEAVLGEQVARLDGSAHRLARHLRRAFEADDVRGQPGVGLHAAQPQVLAAADRAGPAPAPAVAGQDARAAIADVDVDQHRDGRPWPPAAASLEQLDLPRMADAPACTSPF